ncbi:MAG: hypothetical protein M3440_15020, partial [Chloroflexota bacterium]|nr:hypothetical protein [Chloroflexota bacterium]
SGRPFVLSRHELEQAPAPMLSIIVPHGDERTWVTVRLVDKRNQQLAVFQERAAKRPGRFSLRTVLDTIRARSDPSLRLVCSISTGDGYAQWTDVVIIKNSLAITALTVEDEAIDACREIRLTWDERQFVSDKVVRLWSLWRVWDTSQSEVEIPDTARGGFVFQRPQDLVPAGAYRVEMIVRDPWLTARAVPRLPAHGEPHVVDVVFGSKREVERHLAGLPDDEPRGILERFLGTRDPRALDRLAETLDTHEVRDAIAATLSFLDLQDAHSAAEVSTAVVAMEELRKALLGRPDTLPAIADLSASEPERSDLLKRLIVELGVLRTPLAALHSGALSSRQRELLWQLWEPLLLALDGEQISIGDSAMVTTAQVLLGSESMELRIDDNDIGSLKLRVGTPFVFRGDELAYPLVAIRGMQAVWSGIPAGALDDESWTGSNFSWLVRLLSDDALRERATRWLESPVVRAAEADLRNLTDDGITAVTFVGNRWPNRVHGPLGFLPYVVGATALAERAVARGILKRSAMLNNSASDSDAPREAFAAAPELYTRDLCVMDALLLNMMGR